MCYRKPFIFWIFTSLIMTCCQTVLAAQDWQIEGFQKTKSGDFSNAIVCFTSALKEHPNSWQILQSIANCHMELAHYETAISFLQKSVESGGLHPSQCNNMAAIYQRSGDFQKALAWLELECSMDPLAANDPNIASNMRRLKDPANNPKGSINAPDYLTGLVSHKPWNKDLMPLKIFVRPNSNLPNFYPEFLSIIKESLEQWSIASKGAITFR